MEELYFKGKRYIFKNNKLFEKESADDLLSDVIVKDENALSADSSVADSSQAQYVPDGIVMPTVGLINF